MSAELSEFSTNWTDAELRRYQRIMKVRDLTHQGLSAREVAKTLKLGRGTVKKYLNGNPEQLCRSHFDCNRKCEYGVENYLPFITDCINEGLWPAEIHRRLIAKFSYQGSYHAFYNHLMRNKKQNGWTINTHQSPNGHTVPVPRLISRAGLFNYLWNHGQLSSDHKEYLFREYPVLEILDRCIREFRDIFEQTCVNRLHCFIEKYSSCGVKPIESFACNLQNDIDAIENAVSYVWSNGFVEGTNNKLKLVKRSMFGRCSRRLLEAKMLLN